MPDRIQALQQMLADNPDDAFLHFSLGMEYAGQAAWDRAVESFRRCIDLDEGYLAAYVEMGKALRSGGDLAGARAAFAEGMQVATDQGETHVQNYIRQQLNGLPDES